MATTERGTLVQAWLDTESRTIFGVVEKCGPKVMIVRWEIGHRNRIETRTAEAFAIRDPRTLAKARRVMAREAQKAGGAR